MTRLKFLISCLLCLGVVTACASGSTESQSELLKAARSNPLLMDVYNKDPDAARRFWREIETINQGPTYRSSPGAEGAKTSPDDRLVINRNPLIQRLYNKSPLATLRMLARMKEAAGTK